MLAQYKYLRNNSMILKHTENFAVEHLYENQKKKPQNKWLKQLHNDFTTICFI